MKIRTTCKGNVRLTVSKQEAWALYDGARQREALLYGKEGAPVGTISHDLCDGFKRALK